jgi:hypothetical protein
MKAQGRYLVIHLNWQFHVDIAITNTHWPPTIKSNLHLNYVHLTISEIKKDNVPATISVYTSQRLQVSQHLAKPTLNTLQKQTTYSDQLNTPDELPDPEDYMPDLV